MIPFSEQSLPASGVVHIWHISLQDSRLDMPELLSSTELSRYAGFSSATARSDYLRTRTALRMILSSYLKICATDLEFIAGSHGKPALIEECVRHADLRFNLSHSGEHLLLCIAVGCDLGVDVEKLKPGRDYAALAKRFYTDDESEIIKSSYDEQLFYRLWVLKEAAVKARGMKLLTGLDRFECYFSSDDTLLLRDRKEQQESEAWAIRQWQEGCDYVAAVIVMRDEVVFIDKYPEKD